MDSVQQIYVTNQSPLSQTFRASFQKLLQLLCPGFYRWKGKQIVLHVLWLLRIHFFPRCVNNIMHCRCVLSVIHFITSYSCKILFSSQSKHIVEYGMYRIMFSVYCGRLKCMLEQYTFTQLPPGTIFQQDGDPPHYLDIVCTSLNERFPDS